MAAIAALSPSFSSIPSPLPPSYYYSSFLPCHFLFQAHKELDRAPQYGKGARPPWLQHSIAINTEHAAARGFDFKVVELDTPEMFEFQQTYLDSPACKEAPDTPEYKRCYANKIANFARENANWLKLEVIAGYLEEDAADFVLFLDADVILNSRTGHSPVHRFIDELNNAGKDIQFADEDWDPKKPQAVGQINGGVILVRNSEWSLKYLRGLLAAHGKQCKGNEQMCFISSHKSNMFEARDHIHINSGIVWNRHPGHGPADLAQGTFCSNWGDKKCTVGSEIVHYMGGAKGMLDRLVPPPKDTSCFRQACYDVTTCAGQVQHGLSNGVLGGGQADDQSATTRQKAAFVMLHALVDPPGTRFSRNHFAMKAMLHEAKRLSMDAVVLMPGASDAQHPLTLQEERELQEHGFKVAYAQWVYPPGSGSGNALPGRGVCNAYGYLHLHALTLVEYSAVVVLEEGMTIVGNVEPLVWCGKTTELFLAPRGQTSPLSAAVLVASPSASLFAAALKHATLHTFRGASSAGGVWGDGASSADGDGVQTFASDECAAGFLWSMLYSEMGVSDPSVQQQKGAMLDRCSWALGKGESRCHLPCSDVHIVGASNDACHP